MIHSQRIQKVIDRLTKDLNPIHLNVIDESHLHVGHPGAQSGQSHIRIKISCKAFSNKGLIEKHKLIYKSLGTLMETDLHAVAIEVMPTAV